MKAFFAILLMLAAITIIVCSNSLQGTYYNTKNKNEYIVIKSNGTFYVNESDMSISGVYSVNKDTLTFYLPSGFSIKCKIENDTLVDDTGEVWAKK